MKQRVRVPLVSVLEVPDRFLIVPILPGDDEAALSARVLAAEHRLYPMALSLFASGAARVVGERVVFDAGVRFADGAAFGPQPA